MSRGTGAGPGNAMGVARDHLVLMGLRGSGKSTIGRLTAARTGHGFVDLDDRTPRVLGFDAVAPAWEARGEAAFRAAEVEALRAALAEPTEVIALGGGTPTAPGAADLLKNTGATLVYLRCSPAELRERLRLHGVGANRPSLTGGNPLDEIEEVFARRDGLYRSIAAHIVEGVTTPEEGVAKLLGIWK